MSMILCEEQHSECAHVSVAAVGKLVAYDTDGDGDFDVEDAKVLLGKLISLSSATHVCGHLSASCRK